MRRRSEIRSKRRYNLAILSLKKSRKDWARHDVEMEVGSIVGVLREGRD